ncbi:hypothetical protein [Humibacter ginsenosidimutans]|uniref:PAP2 superfamily protein n=1 Tax=Humibacter ginsenosidimutans TaxID=2599293 RepID=A0A5B8M306_9MICO|nr:hypothetical protein [Humibacter ginsenosidimutans]QDZ14977.1 hypothetical protein FPZ11_09560 [Humibacter ginsenosidimutans]
MLLQSLTRSIGWSLAFATLLIAVYAAAVFTRWGQVHLDVRGLGLPAASAALVPLAWLRTGIPVAIGVVAVVVTVFGLARRRWREVATCAVCTVAGIAACILLRDVVFVRPAYGAVDVVNSFPSVHVVTTLSLSIMVVRLWPVASTRRPVAAALVAATITEALVSVATFAHRASDTVGGVLLVGVFASAFARGLVPTPRQALHCTRLGGIIGGIAIVGGAVIAVAPFGVVQYAGFTIATAAAVGVMSAIVMRVASGERDEPARDRSRDLLNTPT